MKGTWGEMGQNRTYVKSRWILWPGHSSVFGSLCCCWGCGWKRSHGAGAGGETHPSPDSECLIFQSPSLNKFRLQPGSLHRHLLKANYK